MAGAREIDPQAVERAIAELEAPTLDAVRAFVAAPGAVADAGDRPCAARVRAVDGEAVLVWFVGAAYPLNLVVEVRRAGDRWRVVWAQADPHVRVALRIVSASLHPDAITAVLGLAPSRQAPAGQTFDGAHGVARREHLWLRDVLPGSPAPLDEKLVALLDALEPNRHALAELGGAVTASVAVAYHAEAAALGSLHLPPRVLARLGSLALTLDIDLRIEALAASPPPGTVGDAT